MLMTVVHAHRRQSVKSTTPMATTTVALPLLPSSVDLCPTNGDREIKRIVEHRKCITSGCASFHPSPLHLNLHHRQTYQSIGYLMTMKSCGKHTAIIQTENNSGHYQTIEIRDEEFNDDCRVFYCGLFLLRPCGFMTSRNSMFRCSHFPAPGVINMLTMFMGLGLGF